jgi:hypothetical protein
MKKSRKWHAQVVGCENDLYEMRVQQLYIADNKAPTFLYFPPDVNVTFFEYYGSRDSGTPHLVDTCGHGPSVLTYNDTIAHVDKVTTGKRVIRRVWRGEDTCGNRVERTQTITLVGTSMFWHFKNFLTFNFEQATPANLTRAHMFGPLASLSPIHLNQTQVDMVAPKCTRSTYACLSSSRIQLDESVVNGAVKTLKKDVDFFSRAHAEAIALSAYLNKSVSLVNVGPRRIVCVEHTRNETKDFPIENFANSTCVQHKRKDFHLNGIDDDGEERPGEATENIVLKGNELVYNVFYFRVIVFFCFNNEYFFQNSSKSLSLWKKRTSRL